MFTRTFGSPVSCPDKRVGYTLFIFASNIATLKFSQKILTLQSLSMCVNK